MAAPAAETSTRTHAAALVDDGAVDEKRAVPTGPAAAVRSQTRQAIATASRLAPGGEAGVGYFARHGERL